MKVKAIIATTHVDSTNSMFAKEALEGMVDQINNSSSAIPLGLEHDSLIPPVGKLISAKLIRLDDGEFAVEAEKEVFGTLDSVVVGGQKLSVSGSLEDKRPFINRHKGIEGSSISFDPVNLGGYKDFEKYKKDLVEDGVVVEVDMHIRKSLIPDPEVVVYISNLVVGGLFLRGLGKAVGDELSKKISQDLAGLYDSLKVVSKKYAKKCLPKNKDIVYIFVMNDIFVVEMALVNPTGSDFDNYCNQNKMNDCIDRALQINENINLSKIQFLLKDGEWIVHFICDKNGMVLTSNLALERQQARFSTMNKK